MGGGKQRIVVVGAGVIGLSVAFRLVRDGHDVVCLDDGKPGVSSHAALGYIAPPSITSVPADVVLFGGQAYHRFFEFLSDIESATGSRPFINENGYIHVTTTAEQDNELDAICGSWDTAGLRYKLMTGDGARDYEPMLGPAIRSAVLMQDSVNVNPGEVTELLRGALKSQGADMRMNDRVFALDVVGGHCAGVTLESGRIDADWVIVSAGSWTTLVLGELRLKEVTPTRGQVVLLRTRGGPVLRVAVSTSDSLDMMPRPNGDLLVGTSNESVGFDTSTTASVLSGILSRALEVVPGVGDYEFVRSYAGLRPCTADRRPVIGPHPACPNVIVAAGHCQNGVLMAPLTADVVSSIVTRQQQHDVLTESFLPN